MSGNRRQDIPGNGRRRVFRPVKLLRTKSGATAVEYGLVAAIISAALVAGLLPMGNSIRSTFNAVSNTFENGD